MSGGTPCRMVDVVPLLRERVCHTVGGGETISSSGMGVLMLASESDSVWKVTSVGVVAFNWWLWKKNVYVGLTL